MEASKILNSSCTFDGNKFFVFIVLIYTLVLSLLCQKCVIFFQVMFKSSSIEASLLFCVFSALCVRDRAERAVGGESGSPGGGNPVPGAHGALGKRSTAKLYPAYIFSALYKCKHAYSLLIFSFLLFSFCLLIGFGF